MTMQDPLADMCTRIRNAGMRHKAVVSMPSSSIKCAVAEVLKQEGFIQDFRVNTDNEKSFPELEVALKYFDEKHVISKIRRVSKPSLRVYKGKGELPRVLNGLGISIISTSKGVMTAKTARANHQGGEVLIEVE